MKRHGLLNRVWLIWVEHLPAWPWALYCWAKGHTDNGYGLCVTCGSGLARRRVGVWIKFRLLCDTTYWRPIVQWNFGEPYVIWLWFQLRAGSEFTWADEGAQS